jgi:hypothetical protein
MSPLQKRSQSRADDPLNFDTVRWLNSALKPPE